MLKRSIDLFFVFFTSPFWIIFILLLIPICFLVNGRPIFFSQHRGGFQNKKITITKFRTIDNSLKINSLGKFLRKSKLDEFPQFLSVLKGDLSIVGPRPLRYEYKYKYKKWHLERFKTRPGLTGWSLNSINI